jgi:hypothetical protein
MIETGKAYTDNTEREQVIVVLPLGGLPTEVRNFLDAT